MALVAAAAIASTITLGGAAAQGEAPDLSAGLPAGVAVTLLGDQVLDPTLGTTAGVRFERVSIAPGGSTDTLNTVGPTLVIGESGNVLLRDAVMGLEAVLEEGRFLSLASDVGYALRNDGTEGIAVLVLTLVPPDADAPADPTGEGVETHALTDAPDVALPESSSHLFALAVSLDPGVSLGENRYAGPLGVVVSDGELALTGPTGLTGTVAEGTGVFLPAGAQNVIANGSGETVDLLIVGVLPEISLVSSRTATGSPDATAEPTALAGLLFSATSKAKQFEDWPVGPSWKVVHDRLLNDGSDGDVDRIGPPFEPGAHGLDDYAVEASIHWIRDGWAYGLFVRSEADESYDGGVMTADSCQTESRGQATLIGRGMDLVNWGGCLGTDDGLLVINDRTWDKKWHTLRMEVSGTTIQLLIDGKLALETDDARLSAGGAVGLWNQGNQIEVRCFAVMTVDKKDVC